MDKLITTNFRATEAEIRKSEILSELLSDSLNSHSKHYVPYSRKLGDSVLLNELYAEGYVTKYDVCGPPQKLTKKGISLASTEGGYYIMVYNRFKKKEEEEELKSLELKIKQKQLEKLEKTQPIVIRPDKALTSQEFELLIQNSESTVVDFKREMYDFDNDTDLTKTAKFVKDVISFTNTIRTETAYIVIGIHEKDDGSKEMLGLDKSIDDAILQAKIKDKVFPVPKFSFSKLIYKEKTYGIFSFPITRYEMPVHPIVKMKGLKVGMPYYRLGSSNEEAIGMTLIHINDWLKSLPITSHEEETFSDKVALLLKRATNEEERLSGLIADTLTLAKSYNLPKLAEFCSDELKGIGKRTTEEVEASYRYRIQRVVFSYGKFQPNPFRTLTSTDVKNFLKAEDNYYEFDFLFNHSITEIESYISRLKSDTIYASLDKTIKQILPDWKGKDYEITLYMFYDTYLQLYKKIRQKLIDNLISF